MDQKSQAVRQPERMLSWWDKEEPGSKTAREDTLMVEQRRTRQ
jgi:hypothetical protein